MDPPMALREEDGRKCQVDSHGSWCIGNARLITFVGIYAFMSEGAAGKRESMDPRFAMNPLSVACRASHRRSYLR